MIVSARTHVGSCLLLLVVTILAVVAKNSWDDTSSEESKASNFRSEATRRNANIACGLGGQVCCYKDCDDGFACDGTTNLCVPCGDDGQLCCEGMKCLDSSDSSTGGSLFCGANGMCMPCGEVEGGPCCSGGTCSLNHSLACDLGVCERCGDIDQICCDGMKCHNKAVEGGFHPNPFENRTDALTCDSLGRCVLCGHPGQPCCRNGGLPCWAIDIIVELPGGGTKEIWIEPICDFDGTCQTNVTLNETLTTSSTPPMGGTTTTVQTDMCSVEDNSVCASGQACCTQIGDNFLSCAGSCGNCDIGPVSNDPCCAGACNVLEPICCKIPSSSGGTMVRCTSTPMECETEVAVILSALGDQGE